MGKKNFIWLIIGTSCIMCSLLLGCGQDKKQEKVLAKINNYTMTVDDFEDEIRYSPYLDEEIEDREQLLDLAIKKQILIQEAQRLGLDRRRTFMKTIERYWKQTLIKELLEKESRRISREVGIDEQDEALSNWVEELYNKAHIKIYREVLQELGEKK